jgi:hypothetical protein
MKAARCTWLTRADFEHDLGMTRTAAREWADELTRQGIFVCRIGPRQGARGISPIYYTLAPEWGGQAKP